MQTPEFANQIFSLKLNSIIAAKLGLDNVQDPAVEVFSKSLVYHLNRKQYVEDDVHKYTYTWDVNDQKSDYKYELTRTVKIYGQDNIHELDSIASGKFEYVLQVGQDNCYSYKAKKDSKPPTQLPKPVGKDKDITCGVWPSKQDGGGYTFHSEIRTLKDRATIAIQLTQFKSDSEVDELEAVHSLGSSYDIRKAKVTFDYPTVCKLVPVGVGAMRTELNKMKPNVDTYGDNTKHEYNFNDGFPYNSMIQFALMCPKLAHDSRKKGSPSLEKFGKRSAKAKK